MAKWDDEYSSDLFRAILSLKSVPQIKRFFRDLLTEQEIIEFSRRWRAAQMLSEKRPYTEIEKETGLSSATVARVAKWLNSGTGGYMEMIRRIKE
jgi:TrpR-related protein YerC/YecD